MQGPLYDHHVALGAKMVDFAGWQMPLQYSGILNEHKAVREDAGLFDVSHMARVAVTGQDAGKFFDRISTNKIRNGKATYTCMCNATGGTIDDMIVYKESEESLFCVFNASRRDADLAHFYDIGKNFDIHITECFKNEGILALQGPFAAKYFPLVKPWSFEKRGDLIISGTGYTGSGGIEIFGPTESIIKLWEELIGKGVTPVGLGARDTLRLEKGYALYGHELSETIAPIESVSHWTVDEGKDFFGKEGFKGKYRKSAGIVIEGQGLAREGFAIFSEGQKIGEVTSGGFSPTLKISIALVLAHTPLSPGEAVEIEIRGNKIPAKVVKLPFI